MNFCQIPVEVVSNNILPLVHKNDLLRLRRVCLHTKSLIDDFIRVYPNLSIQLDLLDANSHSLANFMELRGLVSTATRFHIKNTFTQWIQIQDFRIRNFAQVYGGKITHLTIEQLEIPIVSPDLIFLLDSLTKLQNLRISKLYDGCKAGQEDVLVPEAFLNLQSFHIDAYYAAGKTDSEFRKSASRLWKVFEKCTTVVDAVTHPFIEGNLRRFGGRRSDPGIPFRSICELISNRVKDGKPNLKYVDLKGYEEDGMHSSTDAFYKLIKMCSTYDVKLLNVDAALINDVCSPTDQPERQVTEAVSLVSNTIVSMKNLNTVVFSMELPLLESIWIEDLKMNHGAYVFSVLPQPKYERPSWSKLKQLKLTFGASFLVGTGTQNGVKTREAIQHLFVGIKREALETLDINFGSDGLVYPANFKVTFPKARDIVYSCANLKNLSISNWPGTNKMISQLWEGLPLLEKIELSSCENLGNVAFVGENAEEPVFRKLKRLQVLKLRNLERMPKITDTLFKLVIRHLPLKQLCLTSHCEEIDTVSDTESIGSDSWTDVDEDEPFDHYPSITLAGIRALLTGEFAKTIQVFSVWKELKLKNVTEKELRKLERQFRSSKML